MIHCEDVKPENIPLHSLYCAKVPDFGLSRIENRNQITQTPSKTMHIRGTFGCFAPEYWLADGVSTTNKVDVFSLGMVLLEIISGRHNVLRSASPSGMDAPDSDFPTWAFPKVESETFMDVVDPAVTGMVDPPEVKRALRVAFSCINEKPHVRPSMSEVVQMLRGHGAIEPPVPRPAFFDTLEFKDDEGDHRLEKVLEILDAEGDSGVLSAT